MDTGTIDQDVNGEVAIRYRADVRESASVAHLYGQNLVAAESMTARGNTMGILTGEAETDSRHGTGHGTESLCDPYIGASAGFMIKYPDLASVLIGQWFTRHETWAEQAKPWMTYLSRSSFMLQQGKFVADIIYYYGEDNNITALVRE